MNILLSFHRDKTQLSLVQCSDSHYACMRLVFIKIETVECSLNVINLYYIDIKLNGTCNQLIPYEMLTRCKIRYSI